MRFFIVPNVPVRVEHSRGVLPSTYRFDEVQIGVRGAHLHAGKKMAEFVEHALVFAALVDHFGSLLDLDAVSRNL